MIEIMYFKYLLFVVALTIQIFAMNVDSLEKSVFFIQYIQQIENSEPPRIIANNLIFTYNDLSRSARSAAISFAHENYLNIYSMSYNQHGIYFFVLPLDSIAPQIENVRYRFIIDGIWTHDRANPNLDTTNPTKKISFVSIANRFRERVSPVVVDRTAQFVLSLSENRNRLTEISGSTIFFENDDNLAIFVSGSFNGWNPYMLPLIKSEEDGKIIYSTDIKLTDGVYHY